MTCQSLSEWKSCRANTNYKFRKVSDLFKVTAQVSGYFKPNFCEEFSIQIGVPFVIGLQTGTAPPFPFEPLEMMAGESGNGRRRTMSLASLASSLPDYQSALLRCEPFEN